MTNKKAGEHTQREWKINKHSNELIECNGIVVADLAPYTFDGKRHPNIANEKEIQANARLIAAAPKMLEALEYLMANYNMLPNSKAPADVNLGLAIAAIKAAKGE